VIGRARSRDRRDHLSQLDEFAAEVMRFRALVVAMPAAATNGARRSSSSTGRRTRSGIGADGKPVVSRWAADGWPRRRGSSASSAWSNFSRLVVIFRVRVRVWRAPMARSPSENCHGPTFPPLPPLAGLPAPRPSPARAITAKPRNGWLQIARPSGRSAFSRPRSAPARRPTHGSMFAGARLMPTTVAGMRRNLSR